MAENPHPHPMPTSKHFLIALDDSPASSEGLAYCARLFAADPQVSFRLVHGLVQSANGVVPEPTDRDASLLPEPRTSATRKAAGEQLLRNGRRSLINRGIGAERIETALVPAGSQVARTLMMQAERHLADCIVVARRGIGIVGEMVMGSVSATLFRQLHGAPLWIVDGAVSAPDILVAVDGSVQALRAVDHLAHILEGRDDISIYLYHCAVFLAPAVVCSLESFYRHWDRSWCDAHLSGSGCLFDGPAQLLREAGIPENRIIALPETTHLEESTSIIAQAKKHRCGTIVIGRRGPGIRKGFFGGVANRTIRQTQNMAVWLVG